MALHRTLTLPDLHQAKIPQGLAAARPSTPAGIGDIYWATDTGVLSFTNALGTAWVNFSGGGGGIALDDLTDVVITALATNQLLKYNGTNWVNGNVAINEVIGFAPFTQLLGAILASDGTNFNILAPGVDGEVLTADSLQPLGVKWSNAGSDPTNLLVSLSGW